MRPSRWLIGSALRDDATGSVVSPANSSLRVPSLRRGSRARYTQLAGKTYSAQPVKRILTADDIAGGRDELGVLPAAGMPGWPNGSAYWLGRPAQLR
jgi:hypothetical protein